MASGNVMKKRTMIKTVYENTIVSQKLLKWRSVFLLSNDENHALLWQPWGVSLGFQTPLEDDRLWAFFLRIIPDGPMRIWTIFAEVKISVQATNDHEWLHDIYMTYNMLYKLYINIYYIKWQNRDSGEKLLKWLHFSGARSEKYTGTLVAVKRGCLVFPLFWLTSVLFGPF